MKLTILFSSSLALAAIALIPLARADDYFTCRHIYNRDYTINGHRAYKDDATTTLTSHAISVENEEYTSPGLFYAALALKSNDMYLANLFDTPEIYVYSFHEANGAIIAELTPDQHKLCLFSPQVDRTAVKSVTVTRIHT